MNRNDMLGGNPIGIVIRLALLSLVVGIVLSALGISPANLIHHLDMIARRIYDMGFGAIDWVLRYMLVGAVVVVPIWIVARLIRALGGSRQTRE
jgi:hypothetical protein